MSKNRQVLLKTKTKMLTQQQQAMLASGKLISISNAALKTPYSAEYLSLLARKGRLDAVKISRDWLTTEDAVIQYVKKQEKKHEARLAQFKKMTQQGFAGVKLMLLLLAFGVAITAGLMSSHYARIISVKDSTQSTLHKVASIQTTELFNKENVFIIQKFFSNISGEKLLAAITQPKTLAIKASDFSPRGTENISLNLTQQNSNGQVLAAHTVAAKSVSAPASLTEQVKNILYSYIQQGMFGFNAANYSEDGTMHVGVNSGSASQQVNQSAGVIQNQNGQSSMVIGGVPIITYIQSSPSQNFTGGSVAGFTELSADKFVANQATLQGLTVQNSSIFNGAVSFNNNVNFNGTSTATNLTASNLNLGFTKGSIVFQGNSGLTQDNNNFYYTASTSQLSLGTTTPSTSALLQLESTNKGLLTPRMTQVQRDAIASPVVGLLIFDTTTNGFENYNGSAWVSVGSSSGNASVATGTVNSFAYYSGANQLNAQSSLFINGANIGIGTGIPTQVLDVNGNINTSGTYFSNITSGTNRYFFSATGTVNSYSVYENSGIAYINSYTGMTLRANQNGGSGGDLTVSAGGGNLLLNSGGGNIVISGGNVGIGTSTPNFALAVNGISASVSSEPGAYGQFRAVNNVGYLSALQTTGSAYAGSEGPNIGSLYTNAPNGLLIETNSQPIYFSPIGSTSTPAMKILVNGNVGIGTSTPIALLSLNASTTAAGGINFGDADANLYRSGAGQIKTDGGFVIGNGNLSVTTGNPLLISGGLANNSTNVDVKIENGNSVSITSGTRQEFMVKEMFNPTSGTGVFNLSELQPTINQTGGANGITRGLYINPTITSAFDFRALEVATGTSIFLGNVGIGTTSPSVRLEVKSAAVSTVGIQLTQSSSGNPLAYFRETSGGVGQMSLFNSTNSANVNLVGSGDNYINSGNVGIGTTTPNATLFVNGTGVFQPVTDSLTAYSFNNASGSPVVTISSLTAAGSFGGGARTTVIFGFGSAPTPTAASGANILQLKGSFFSPTSGSAPGIALSSQLGVNQTNLAKGITRDILISPTLTSATDYRALEVAAYSWTLSTSTSITTGQQVLFNAPTITSASSTQYNLTNAYSLNVNGAPAGTTASTSIANSVAINVASNALTNVTNGVGLQVAAPTGAANNYAALFTGGNVGIGTTSPGQGLSIGSNASGKNVQIANGWLCVDNNDTCTGATTAGTVYAVGTYTTGADVAENYPTNEILEAGDVVMADKGTPIFVKKANLSPTLPSEGEGAAAILGIVSTKPGVLLNGYKSETFGSASTVPVALSGRVPVKVTNENGNIKIGDYLAPSKKFFGFAMKATEAGQVLGRALESFDGDPSLPSTSSGPSAGKILIFMQVSYYQPKVSELLQTGVNTDNQAWLQSLTNLNMTNAAVFGDIAVQGSVAVQKDLHVGGIIYAAELDVDTLVAKQKVCIGQTCLNEDQLKAVLKLLDQQQGSVAPPSATSSGPSGQPSSGSSTGTSTPPTPSPTPTPVDPNSSSTPPQSLDPITPPADPPAPSPIPTP